jgi:hypothetical protein
MRVIKIIAVITITLLLFYSCSKDKSLPGYITDLSFSYTDTLYVGRPIRFSSTAAASSSFLWTFGTGETSTADSPYYTYLVPRPFNVTLKINDTGTPVSKTIYISIGQAILTKITTSRTWNLHYTAHNPSGSPVDTDTTYSYSGGFFNINNDTSISVAAGILTYIYPGTVLPTGRYVEFGEGPVGNNGYFWSKVHYDYSIDSLDYIIYTPISSGFEKYEYSSTH